MTSYHLSYPWSLLKNYLLVLLIIFVQIKLLHPGCFQDAGLVPVLQLSYYNISQHGSLSLLYLEFAEQFVCVDLSITKF